MLNIIVLIFIIIIAACIGSFCNMLIYRLPRNQEIVFKRSHCTKCNRCLGFLQLIPVISYIWQKGKCAFCKQKISFRYFIVEILAVIISLFIFSDQNFSFISIKLSVFYMIVLIGFFTDIETKLLPNSLTYSLMILGLSFSMITKSHIDSILGLLIIMIILVGLERIAFWYYKQEALGYGDIKLMMGIGAFWGYKIALLGLTSGIIIGGICSVILLIFKKVTRKSYIALGPFLIIGTCLSIHFQDFLL